MSLKSFLYNHSPQCLKDYRKKLLTSPYPIVKNPNEVFDKVYKVKSETRKAMTKCKKPTPYDPKLIAAQCDYGQGYLFARPMPEDAFLELIACQPA